MFDKESITNFLEGIKFFLSLHTPFGSTNTIRLELDEMYIDSSRLIKATVQYLKNEGRDCTFSGEYIGSYPVLKVDGSRYALILNTIGSAATRLSVQQVMLKEI
ncbi:hypothetical protein BX659_111109 [Orenia metallireducens]|uniref:Uncharacterized protein n=1 Tax=Orenia metallireducens TaxID=1413210 RepID=A0A285HBD0_9FIRM|nr:hypothetical protein [Orenia metallireducens]PRX28990.1 hypothetical protein BX659_111109 [Orenia metallireducens]SNY33050.1 hypothetical protein SAMN06265827_116109 [Orenia metallireducens]